MKRFPLQVLISARQIRVDKAAAEVTRARTELDQKIAAHAKIVHQRELKQAEHDQQRIQLFESATDALLAAAPLNSLAQREHNIGLLLEQLDRIDQARFAAQTEVETATVALRAAVALHLRAQAKLDLLLERKKQWRITEQRSVDERDEQFAEEIFLAQHAKEQRNATTPSRH